MCDPFALTKPFNFSLDQRTRVMLFAVGLELMPGEDISIVTAQAEDSTHKIYPSIVYCRNWLDRLGDEYSSPLTLVRKSKKDHEEIER